MLSSTYPGCGDTVLEDISSNPKHQTEFQFCATSKPADLEAGAASGDPEAMYWLANCFFYGENSFPEDDEAAKKWVRKAAAAGYPRAVTDAQAWFPHKPSHQKLGGLFANFENLIIFDVETSGLSPETDQIIELAALKVNAQNGDAMVTETFDELIRLPEGQRLSPKIKELTNITDEILQRAGKAPSAICHQFVKLLTPEKTLMIAYNAQFDMSFLQNFLCRYGESRLYQSLHALDAMTIYKDRKEYPHKLSDAIQAYQLDGVQNSHQALDDTKSLLEVLLAMDQERDDLAKYIDLFGFNPKWGISGTQLPGIRYAAQPYNNFHRLYE